MQNPKNDTVEMTYPLRTAARLTGLSPQVLRAWERRYGVVVPVRTPGGTRRYSAADLERLRLVKAAVDAGNRIGKVADLPAADLERLANLRGATSSDRLEEVFRALEDLDAVEAQRLLGHQLASLGPDRFTREFATPLVDEIGSRWARDELSIASEHLATGVLRSMLGSIMQPTATSLLGPRVLFATPSGERHELGLLMAALTTLSCGGSPVYLGAEVPAEDLLEAADRTGAAVLALSLVSIPAPQAVREIATLREGLPSDVGLWVGGAGATDADLPKGVEAIETLGRLQQRVGLLVATDARGT